MSLINKRGRTFAFVTWTTMAGFGLVIFLTVMVDRNDKVAQVAGTLYMGFAGMVAAGTLALGGRSMVDAHKQQGPTSEGA